MEPATTITTAWTLAKTAADITAKLYEFGKSLKGREEKQRVDEMLDKLRELKQSASQLEDENRELHEKLRFKSDEFEWQKSYWLDKNHPERPLCPPCLSKQVIGPLLEMYESNGRLYRRCSVCTSVVQVDPPSIRKNKGMTDMRGI